MPLKSIGLKIGIITVTIFSTYFYVQSRFWSCQLQKHQPKHSQNECHELKALSTEPVQISQNCGQLCECSNNRACLLVLKIHKLFVREALECHLS